jgi:hypothetical protein
MACPCGLKYSGGGVKRKTRKCRYKPTSQDKMYFRRWKKGESIGFTKTASLKAKGMIPRTGKTMRGKKMVSDKYCAV